jgi:hypothetical protein
MNCLKFRRLIDTDPLSQDEDVVRHKAECESCAGFASRAVRFSAALNAAARVEVPENLASRVLLRQSYLPFKSNFSRRGVFALAASLFVVVSLALSAAVIVNLQDPLAREIFTLIRYADYAMEPKIPLGEEPVAKAIARAGLKLEGRLEKVTFAGNCLLQQKIAGHLVIQGEKAPITVFLTREMQVNSETAIRSDNLRGIVVPMEKGAIIVVGAPDESLTILVENISAAVSWRHA